MDTNILKTRVKGQVKFSHFQDEVLYYICDDGFEFPVPVADTRNAQGGSPRFEATSKGITFMTWIRKQMLYEDVLRAKRGAGSK